MVKALARWILSPTARVQSPVRDAEQSSFNGSSDRPQSPDKSAEVEGQPSQPLKESLGHLLAGDGELVVDASRP